MAKSVLTNWEWLTLLGVIVSAGVGVTVYAMNTFEASGAAKEVKRELKTDLSRVERKVDALLLHEGLKPQKYEDEHESP